MSYVKGWCVWYDDDSTYDSVSSSWSELPDDGILIRLVYYEDGTRQIQQGMDYYYEAPHHSGETIIGTGSNLRKIKSRYPGAVVKRGRWAPDEYYRDVVKRALKWRWDDGS